MKKPPPKSVRYFDHVRSERVDVIPNKDGEFVQVWDSAFGTSNRKLLLSYQRTPEGPKSISSRIYLEDGPWALVETTGSRRTFYHRDLKDRVRYEEILPSGRVLIDDFAKGMIVRSMFTADFDWESKEPTGPDLDDRAILKRQSKDQPYFVSQYQEQWDGEDLVVSELVAVAEHRGNVFVTVHELAETGA